MEIFPTGIEAHQVTISRHLFLTGSSNPRDYWFKMKQQVKLDDGFELSTTESNLQAALKEHLSLASGNVRRNGNDKGAKR